MNAIPEEDRFLPGDSTPEGRLFDYLELDIRWHVDGEDMTKVAETALGGGE